MPNRAPEVVHDLLEDCACLDVAESHVTLGASDVTAFRTCDHAVMVRGRRAARGMAGDLLAVSAPIPTAGRAASCALASEYALTYW